MSIVKKILFIILLLIVAVLVTALFVNKEYKVERFIVINKPKAEVFKYIKYLKNQSNYSKRALMDPKMKKIHKGTDGMPGFISAWESKNENLGVGEQEIKKITDGERMDFELRFKKPFEATEHTYMTTQSVNNHQTKVSWGFNGHMNYPMNIMLLFMNFENMIGDDLQVGLNNLKMILEK